MAVLLDSNTRLIVQGLTGREGTFHAKAAAAYGTQRRRRRHAGQGRHDARGLAGLQQRRTTPCARPAPMRRSSSCRRRLPPTPSWRRPTPAIPLVVCITEGIPVVDMLKVMTFMHGKPTRLVGPNCPGIITAGQAKAGIIPGHICREGRIGIVSKSGTLTYEAIHQLSKVRAWGRRPASASAAIR